MKRLQNFTIFCENYVILHAHIAKLGQFWASGMPNLKNISQNRQILSDFAV